MQANRSGSYEKYREYYDKYVNRIHQSYKKDFQRFERFAIQNYKKRDQRAFIAIKTAMYAKKLNHIKVAACLTASVINYNKTLVEGRQLQIHPRLLRAATSLHKQIVQEHTSVKKRPKEIA